MSFQERKRKVISGGVILPLGDTDASHSETVRNTVREREIDLSGGGQSAQTDNTLFVG